MHNQLVCNIAFLSGSSCSNLLLCFFPFFSLFLSTLFFVYRFRLLSTFFFVYSSRFAYRFYTQLVHWDKTPKEVKTNEANRKQMNRISAEPKSIRKLEWNFIDISECEKKKKVNDHKRHLIDAGVHYRCNEGGNYFEILPLVEAQENKGEIRHNQEWGKENTGNV